MKKFKESLWFVIPFLVLSAVSVLHFIANMPKEPMYFRLMMRDPILWKALFNTYVRPFLISFVITLVFKLVWWRRYGEKTVAKKVDYLLVFLISLMAAAPWVGVFGAIYSMIFALQISILITFMFWVIDAVRERRKKKSAEE